MKNKLEWLFHICVKFDVNWIYLKTLAAFRSHTLFRSFYYTKNRTSTALSNFCEFLKNKNSLESLNMIFRISSPKGILGKIWAICQIGPWPAFHDPNSQPFLRTQLTNRKWSSFNTRSNALTARLPTLVRLAETLTRDWLNTSEPREIVIPTITLLYIINWQTTTLTGTLLNA